MEKKLSDYMKEEEGDTEDSKEEEMGEDEHILEMYHMLQDDKKAELMDILEEMCYSEDNKKEKSKSGAVVITIGKGK